MPELQEELEIKRLENLVEAFGWVLKSTERSGDEVVVSFSKPCVSNIPEEVVGAD